MPKQGGGGALQRAETLFSHVLLYFSQRLIFICWNGVLLSSEGFAIHFQSIQHSICLHMFPQCSVHVPLPTHPTHPTNPRTHPLSDHYPTAIRPLFSLFSQKIIKNVFFLICLPPGRRLLLTLGMGLGLCGCVCVWVGGSIWDHFKTILETPYAPQICLSTKNKFP